MNQNLKQFIYGAILLGGGLYLGQLYGKVDTLRTTGGMLVSSHYDGASNNLNTHISLLQSIQANDIKSTTDKLEKLVDTDLMALSQYSPPQTPCKTEIQKSIEKAKEYREKHPVSNRSQEVINTINKAFSLVTNQNCK